MKLKFKHSHTDKKDRIAKYTLSIENILIN